jgi:hypothetical protein
VAEVERAKAAAAARTPRPFRGEVVPGVAIWPPWNKVLSVEEWEFTTRLLPRRRSGSGAGGGPWPDWRDAHRAACQDAAELATLEAIFAKEDRLPAAERGVGLRTMLNEYGACLPWGEEDEEDEEEEEEEEALAAG